MFQMVRTGTALLLAALAVTAAEGQERKEKEKPASSPEEAVKLLQEALRAGDPRGVMNRLAEPERSALAYDLLAQPLHEQFRKALDDKFGKDANAQLPRSVMSDLVGKFLLPSPAAQTEDPPEKATGMDLQVRSKEEKDKGRVLLTVWLTWVQGNKGIAEHRWEAVKEGDDWKLLTHVFGEQSTTEAKRKTPDNKDVEVVVVSPGGFQPTLKMSDYVKEVLPKSRIAVERFCKQVRDGEYASRAEALKAYGKLASEFAKANPLPRTEPQIRRVGTKE
jgi:hypothetical protein